MSDITQQIRTRIEEFVSEIASLVREATLGSVYATLGAVEARTRGGRPTGARRGRASLPTSTAGRSQRSGKRSSDEIEAMGARILEHVKKAPGQGVEQISEALGISSKELTLPIRKLIRQKSLRTTGQKRATKYFLASARGAVALERQGSSSGARRRAASGGRRKKKAGRRHNG